MRAGASRLSAITIAESFRDEEHHDVLLLIDNVFRFVQAGSEISGLLGRLPSRVGYQPTLATEIAELQERIAISAGHSITAIEAVYVPADDYTDPAVAQTFNHLDSSIVLSRSMASEGLYPAIDPLASTSVLLDPAVVGESHFALAQEVPRAIAHYRGLQEIISLLGIEELSAEDRLDELIDELVFAELMRAAMESFASENGARLATMEAAHTSIDRKLDELSRDERQRRQDEITTELLDIVTGSEAVLG